MTVTILDVLNSTADMATILGYGLALMALSGKPSAQPRPLIFVRRHDPD